MVSCLRCTYLALKGQQQTYVNKHSSRSTLIFSWRESCGNKPQHKPNRQEQKGKVPGQPPASELAISWGSGGWSGNCRCPVHTAGSDLGQAPQSAGCGILVVITPPCLQPRASSSPPRPQSFPAPFWRFPCHPRPGGAHWEETTELASEWGTRSLGSRLVGDLLCALFLFFAFEFCTLEQVLPTLKLQKNQPEPKIDELLACS